MRIRNSGFTMIELMLSMSFVSILLIAIAMLTIQLTNQYTRGITLKEIAQAGTEASSELKRTLSQEQIGVKGIRYVSSAGVGTVLCTGTYSYIANDPANLEADSNLITVGVGSNKVPARLMKVRDENGTYCDTLLTGPGDKEIEQSDATELLSGGSRLLVVRGLKVTPNGVPSTGVFADEFSQGRGIYNVELTIGTGVDSELSSSTSCKPPSDQTSNLEFCAIDTFKFTTRVGSSNR